MPRVVFNPSRERGIKPPRKQQYKLRRNERCLVVARTAHFNFIVMRRGLLAHTRQRFKVRARRCERQEHVRPSVPWLGHQPRVQPFVFHVRRF